MTDFDDFMKIPPCATGTHSLEPAEPLKPAVVESPAPGPSSTSADGKEIYGSAMASTTQPAAHLPPLPAAPQLAHEDSVKKPVSTEYVEEQDDPDVEITKGMRCKRKACGAELEDQTREDGECTYHPGVVRLSSLWLTLPVSLVQSADHGLIVSQPIFHEGSKGYSCCKRRVLEFDEFLRIEGCRSGRHLFVGPKKVDDGAEELVDCRTDHYQTPRTVIVSVFGKQADKEKSSVKFEAEAVRALSLARASLRNVLMLRLSQMHVDLILPARKRFTKSFPLYGPIDPASSAFKILGTKCEITLAKADARSWPSITTLDPDLASKFRVQLAFSAGGGRGTVGAKEAVLDQTNQLYRNAAA